jgi:lipid A 3-O-deacylase
MGWRRPASTQTELILSAWRADAYFGGHQDFWHLTLLPVLRMRLDEGRSPWFFDAGIGVSYTHKLYVTPHNAFGSQWNFYDMLGVGYSFGARQQDEVELRYVHLSNGGFKDPNPGENFVQLRYAHRF